MRRYFPTAVKTGAMSVNVDETEKAGLHNLHCPYISSWESSKERREWAMSNTSRGETRAIYPPTTSTEPMSTEEKS